MAALAALLLVLFSPSASGVAGGGGARGWLSRVRGFAARRLPSRRALSLSAQSCDCVTLGWDANAAAAFSTSSPAGTRAAAVLPAGCLEGLQADCAAGRLNATECELQALDESLLGLTFIRYFPSEVRSSTPFSPVPPSSASHDLTPVISPQFDPRMVGILSSTFLPQTLPFLPASTPSLRPALTHPLMHSTSPSLATPRSILFLPAFPSLRLHF